MYGGGRECCGPYPAPAAESGLPNPKGEQMLTTTALEDDIRASLLDDPRIPDPSEIAVLAEDGVVTLRGTVGRFKQRRAAVSDARSADQDYDVRDDLNVRLLDEWAREDADIRG